MTKEEFKQLLKKHDWYYQYSDDHRVYCRGRDELAVINKVIKNDPEKKEIYKSYIVGLR